MHGTTPGMRSARGAASALAGFLVCISLVLAGCTNVDENVSHEAAPTIESVPPGTPLRDGFSVVEGTHFLGPVLDVPTSVLEFYNYTPAGPAWRAFLVVDREPERVWADYVTQLTAEVAAGGDGGAEVASCFPYAPSQASAKLSCVAFGRITLQDGGVRNAVLTLRSTGGDVNNGYVLLIDVADENFLGAYPDTPSPSSWPEGQQFPDPVQPLTPPQPGDRLAPQSTDVRDYVLIQDTQLLAVYGGDGGTGGLEVLLSVAEGADTAALAQAYLDQTATTGDAPGCRPAFDAAEAQVSTCGPVGGAGGYAATITVVDRLQGEDYLLYEAIND